MLVKIPGYPPYLSRVCGVRAGAERGSQRFSSLDKCWCRRKDERRLSSQTLTVCELFLCFTGAKSFREVLHELTYIKCRLHQQEDTGGWEGSRALLVLCKTGGEKAIWKFPLQSEKSLRLWYFEGVKDGWLPAWSRCVHSFCRLPLRAAARKARKGPNCPFSWANGRLKILLFHAPWNTLTLFTCLLNPPYLFTGPSQPKQKMPRWK